MVLFLLRLSAFEPFDRSWMVPRVSLRRGVLAMAGLRSVRWRAERATKQREKHGSDAMSQNVRSGSPRAGPSRPLTRLRGRLCPLNKDFQVLDQLWCRHTSPHEVSGAQCLSRRLILAVFELVFVFSLGGPTPSEAAPPGRAPTDPEINNARPGHTWCTQSAGARGTPSQDGRKPPWKPLYR